MPRPTHKELSKKLRQAQSAFENGCVVAISPNKHLPNDMDYFEVADVDEYFELIETFVQEIIDLGGADLYTGNYPPSRCYETNFKDEELFAFSWDSPCKKEKLYLKFGIKISKKDPTEVTFCYLDCHQDDP